MSYHIRLMRKEDVTQINEIDREAFPTQWPPPNYQRELQNKLARLIVACDEAKTVEEPVVVTPPERGISRLASRVMELLNADRLFGQRRPPTSNQHVLGFAGIWVMADEAHLTNIAVRNRYHRQGIGERLLISMIDAAKEMRANTVTLEVRVSNTIAQSLYHKYDFTQTGVRSGYYTDNREDGVLMSTSSITSASYQERLQQLKQAHATKYGTIIEKFTPTR